MKRKICLALALACAVTPSHAQTAMTRAQLEAANNSAIQANGTGAITGTILNNILGNFAASMVTQNDFLNAFVYPPTIPLTGILFGNGTSAVTAITPVANGVLVTNGSGVPSISTTLPTGLALQTPGSVTLTNGAGLPVTGISATGTPSSTTYLRGDGSWQAIPGSGTVTSVGASFTGGVIGISGSPITNSGTLAFTVAGTSGGIPYFSSASTWASSAALAANALVVGGGAGTAPSTVTTGANVLTALGVNIGSAGSVVVNGGALGTPSSGAVATTLLTGTLQAAQEPAHTGDATNTAGSLALTVGSIGGKTVSLGGTFTMSGSYNFTGTLTGATGITFPTSGTLATTANINTALPSATSIQLYGGTGSAGVAQAITLGTNLSISGTTLNASGGGSTAPVSQVRQTVQSGPGAGAPTLFPATSASLSLTSQNVSGTYPLTVSSANGFNSTGDVNNIGISASNLTWSSLTASTTNYLFVTVSSGALTAGSVTLAPIYQFGGTISVTNNQYTFDISQMIMFVGNGTTASQTNVVFVGEAVTGASTVTSTVAYAYNGYYYSGRFSVSASTTYSKSDNIGVPGPYVIITATGDTTTNGVLYPFQNIYVSQNYGAYATKYDRNTSQLYTQPVVQVMTGAGGTAVVEAAMLARRAF
jgi:hypothetical protein